MTLTSYYRRALWVPILAPASVVVVGLIGNSLFGQETPFLQLAAVLSVPLPGYVPIALWTRWKMKKGTLNESELSKIAKVTPLIVGLIGAVVAILYGSLPQGGVMIALLIIFFGYSYVAAIELGRAIGSRFGWVIASSQDRLS
jgi:hypothetical protein